MPKSSDRLDPQGSTTLYMPRGVLEEIREIAKRERRSFSGQVTYIVEDWLRRYKQVGQDGGARTG